MVDEIDKKLLFELNWNCRQTLAELGKKLRISKQVAGYRIKKLEEDRIITGYHVLLDWRRLGYNAVRVYWKWEDISLEKEQQIYERIKNDPFFMWSVKLEGEIDIAFYVWVKNVQEFAAKWFSFLETFKKNILKQELYESVEMVHYPMKPLVEGFFIKERVAGIGQPVSYDQKDYLLIKALTEDASMPIIDLAEKIALNSKSVISRKKNLEKNGIVLGYNALIDWKKLGYNFYKIDFYLNDLSKLTEMFNFAKLHKNIVYRMRTIGGPDYEIEVMVKDVEELKSIINEIRTKFPDTIKNYRFHRFEKTLKQVYLPGESLKPAKPSPAHLSRV